MTDCRISGRLLLHFSCVCRRIFTVAGSLQFGMFFYHLASDRTSLVHWASKTLVSIIGSRYVRFRGADEAALVKRLIVVDFAVVLRMVLTCARCRTWSSITLFLSLCKLQGSAGSMSMS